jgi:hypothetical protein
MSLDHLLYIKSKDPTKKVKKETLLTLAQRKTYVLTDVPDRVVRGQLALFNCPMRMWVEQEPMLLYLAVMLLVLF